MMQISTIRLSALRWLRRPAVDGSPASTSPAPAPVAFVAGPVDIPNPDDWTDGELEALVAGKVRPKRIHEDCDKIAFYQATDAERDAWNAYADRAADEFNSDPGLDSYDSVDVYPGWSREGRQIPWIPPTRFPEWVAARRRGA